MRSEGAGLHDAVVRALGRRGLPMGPLEPAVRLLAEIVAGADAMVGVSADDVTDLVGEWGPRPLELSIHEDAWPRPRAFDRPGPAWLASLEAAVAEIAGGPELTLHEVARCAEVLQTWLAPDVELVLGTRTDESLSERVTLRLVGWRAPQA